MSPCLVNRLTSIYDQNFRLLRSRTGTFSTILERINKLNYVALIECSECSSFRGSSIVFFNWTKNLKKTFDITSTIEDINNAIIGLKSSAIDDIKKCSMILQQYDSTYFMLNTIEILVSEDDNSNVADKEVSGNGTSNPDCTENSLLQEDHLKIRLRRRNIQGMPTATK